MSRRLTGSLLGLLGVVLLAGCSSPHAPSAVGPGRVEVSTPALAKVKAASDVPTCPRSRAPAAAGGLPSVTVACLGGGPSVDLAALRGPLVVNFWSSTCTICRREMPALAAYAARQSEVGVLGIDFLDVQPGAALQLAAASKVGYPLLADPGGVLSGQGALPTISGLPLTVFVDATGRVVGREFGGMTSRAEVEAAVSKYLGVPG